MFEPTYEQVRQLERYWERFINEQNNLGVSVRLHQFSAELCRRKLVKSWPDWDEHGKAMAEILNITHAEGMEGAEW